MMRIMKDRWGANQDKLRIALAEQIDRHDCDYETLVKLTFETIYNSSESCDCEKLDLDHITVIDNGDYQGTILFMIPYDTYQPSEYEYIMTYIGYGSCCGCDALQAALGWDYDEKLSDEQVVRFMAICKDLVCNTIKPYNNGWRSKDEWEPCAE